MRAGDEILGIFWACACVCSRARQCRPSSRTRHLRPPPTFCWCGRLRHPPPLRGSVGADVRLGPQSSSNMTPGQFWQGGFGAYLEQGYGCCYGLRPHSIWVSIATRTTCPTTDSNLCVVARIHTPKRRGLTTTRGGLCRETQVQARTACGTGRHGPPGGGGRSDAAERPGRHQAQQAVSAQVCTRRTRP
jgi:hypothetical protein